MAVCSRRCSTMVISSLSTDPSAPAPPALFLDIGQDGRLDKSGSAPAVATGVHEDPRAHRAGTALLATSGDGAAQAVGQVCPRWPDLIIRTLSRRKAERRQESVYKVMLFVRRKDGLTREQFRRRYEEGHAPLARKVLPQLRRYVRNYVTDSPGWEADFDVIIEFWFDSERDHQGGTGLLRLSGWAGPGPRRGGVHGQVVDAQRGRQRGRGRGRDTDLRRWPSASERPARGGRSP
jgi:hypothetical protein